MDDNSFKQTAAFNLKKFYTKRIKKISVILDKNASDVTTDDVHQLRVEIKKIKATFALIASMQRKFGKTKYFYPFKGLFKRAGKVRALQIELASANTYELGTKGNNYVNVLKRSENKAQRKFEKIFRHRQNEHPRFHQNKKLNRIFRKISAKDIRKYVLRLSRELSRLFEKKVFKEEELHVVRKKLKSFFLIAGKMLSEKSAGELERFLDVLGRWHDQREAFLHLMKFAFSSDITAGEMMRIDEIKSQLLTEKKDLFDQILSIAVKQKLVVKD